MKLLVWTAVFILVVVALSGCKSCGRENLTSTPKYSGQCLTTYQTNKKAYGKKIASACTLYFGQPEQDPCHCAQQFVSNRTAGMDMVDLAAAFHKCNKNTVYSPGGCTSPTCSPYCCSYPKSYCRKGN